MAQQRAVVVVDAEDTPFCATGADLVADRLFSLGASAVSETRVDDGTRVRLVADLPAAAVDSLLAAGLDVELLEVDPTWAGRWQDHAVASLAGRRLRVRPEWVASTPVAERVDVVVDAATSFGSGSHPTTCLCLAALDDLVRSDDRVLDVGCGTGVLGVAALLLGAASLVALDIAPQAVAATARTAELNGVDDRLIEVSTRPLPEVTAGAGPFDLVLANLLIPIVEDLGGDLARAVAPGGHLVVGGLLADGDHVGRAIAATSGLNGVLEVIDVTDTDGWAIVVLTRSVTSLLG
ncbi:MAG: 50S ribosomal protein L11 methyltransferase [Microthrixaceae bacterium]|nr:50S ribosomal protein L11 methyltransferase [Microthrixaceae bacterium]